MISPLSDPQIIPNPYPTYAALAQKEPVHWWAELNAWAVLTHAGCFDILNSEQFKADRMEALLVSKFPESRLETESLYYRFTQNVMMFADPPKHEGLRSATQAAFNHEAYAYYNEAIEQVARDLIGSLTESKIEVDAVTELAKHMPRRCAVHAFGVPSEDVEFIRPRAEAIHSYWSGPGEQPVPLNLLLENLQELHVYAHGLLEGKKGKVLPKTVIARLAAAAISNGTADSAPTLHQLVLLLVALFAPTTPGSISSGILAFADNPKQIARLQSGGISAASIANEVVRYNASNQFTWRVAIEPVEISGIRIEAGQMVASFLGAANRDAMVFDRPNEFDLARPNSAQHLSFGSGIHSCLGRRIAMAEISWFFTALFGRFSKVNLTGTPEWNPNLEFRSLKTLPVAFS